MCTFSLKKRERERERERERNPIVKNHALSCSQEVRNRLVASLPQNETMGWLLRDRNYQNESRFEMRLSKLEHWLSVQGGCTGQSNQSLLRF